MGNKNNAKTTINAVTLFLPMYYLHEVGTWFTYKHTRTHDYNTLKTNGRARITVIILCTFMQNPRVYYIYVCDDGHSPLPNYSLVYPPRLMHIITIITAYTHRSVLLQMSLHTIHK